MLDLFSGAGGISAACTAHGLRALSFDINNGPTGDLTSRKVLQQVVTRILDHRVKGVIMGPPCTTFSCARDRNSKIRSRRCAWGLLGLMPRLAQQVVEGNQLARAAIAVLRACIKSSTPVVCENPATSRLFLLPEMRRIISLPQSRYRVVDMCQYGTSWRKPTGLLFINFEDAAVDRCAKPRCTTKRCICSRSNKKHLVLSGNSPEGIPWTRIAQTYPRSLCNNLSLALIRNSQLRRPPVPA